MSSLWRSKKWLRFTAAIACGSLVFLLPWNSDAQIKGASTEPEPFELVLVDMPLGDAVKAIADRTGNDYVFEPPLPGRVTVAVPSRVSADEATEILNATLLIKGFVALPIAPKRYVIARWEKMAGSAPYSEAKPDPEAERAITTRFQLHRAGAEAVARALHPMLQDKGEAIAHPASNSLILAGTENRIARLIEIARGLDSAAQEHMIVRRLRYRDAEEVRMQLSALMDRTADGGHRGAQLDAIVDERTNALLLTGSESDLEQLREWIDVMDIPTTSAGGLHVVHLIHQDPTELAALLESQSTAQVVNDESEQSEVDSGPLIGKDYSVTPYPATRSIVVRSDRQIFGALSHLIGKLDREPHMVRVDVNIFEILTEGNLALGAGAAIPAIEPKAFDDLALVALVNPGLLDVPNLFPGFNFGDSPVRDAIGRPSFSIQGENTFIPIVDGSGLPILGPNGIPQFVAVPGLGITMFSQEVYTEINIKQRPSIVVEVGQEAELFVGDNIPIPVGSENTPGSEFGLSIGITIQRQDVGTSLRLKPVVSNEGDVRLDLELELDSIRSAAVPALGPILAKRSVKTSFVTGFGQRMIIAGLNGESKGRIETGIPFLSAIPFFGRFFTASLDSTRRNYIIYSINAESLPTSEERQAQEASLKRAVERLDTGLESQNGARYAIRAASYYKREIAEAALEDLDVSPWDTLIKGRDSDDGKRFDLFVMGLPRMADVALTALKLERAGLRPEIIALSSGVDAVR